MSNLKGGSFDKQIRDSNFRMNQYGNSKNDCDKSHQTHSNQIGIQRDGIMNDFKNHLQDNGIDDGKLNQHMTNDNINSFLENRLDGMKYSSQETYIRGMSSLVQGLQENGIDIPMNRSDFDNINQSFKDAAPDEVNDISKSFHDNSIQDIKDGLYNQSFNSGVMGEVQLETGLRFNEMKNLIENKDSYIKEDGKIEGLIGKGGQEVLGKELSPELISKINQVNTPLPSLSTYNNHIGKVEDGKTSHSLRYEYIKNSINDKVENNTDGKSMEEIKGEVSEEILHHRHDIINSYIDKM